MRKKNFPRILNMLIEYSRSNHVDIFVIAETKIDKSFPTVQFIIEGFHKPLRLDNSDKNGGLLIYIRSYLLSHQLTKFEIPSDIQTIPFEKREMVFFMHIQATFYEQSIFLDFNDNYSNAYGNHIVIGYFNLEPSQMYLKTFMETPNYFIFLKNNACFKDLNHVLT